MPDCATCGTPLAAGARCATCEPGKALVLTAEPGTFRWEAFPVSIIVASTDPATGDARIRVEAPGMRSEGHLSPEGRVSLAVEGAGEIGKAGEARATKTLRHKLQADGLTISTHTGRDGHGEDGLLSVGDVRYTLQLVTTPSVPAFWREAHVGSAMTQVETQQAVEWVRATLLGKAGSIPPAQRPHTVLAIDARHAGVLATTPILEAYANRFGAPAGEFGFASVWLVGPTVQHCARIGEGTP